MATSSNPTTTLTCQSRMSLEKVSIKTPYRRRRKVKTDDKENKGNATEEQFGDDVVIFSKTTTTLAKNNDEESVTCLGDTVLIFREALSQVPSARVFFQTHRNLDESVIRCSLCPQSTTGLWHVQEHGAALISLSRKLIKQTTDTDTRDVKNLLLIAVHCLRAVVTLKDHDSNVETCIRLLYHLITAEQAKDSMIVIAGFEAITIALQNYTCLSSNDRKVRFLAPSNTMTWGLEPSFVNTSSTDTTMTLRQIVTIVFKTCLSCVSTVHHLWWERLANQTSMATSAAMYGSLASFLLRQSPIDQPLQHSLWLVQTCYLPCLSFVADSNDQECIKDLTTHCKTAHRALWDAAIKLKDTDPVLFNPGQLENICLDIRKHAIELLLPKAESTQGERFIQKHFLEQACGYAWKAASVYAQQESSLPVMDDSALAKFHQSVGSRLDHLQLPQNVSVSYVEYSVYRALHCGVVSTPQTYWAKPTLKKQIDIHSVILAAALIGIRAKYSLVELATEIAPEERCSKDLYFPQHTDYLEHIISVFTSKVLPEWMALQNEIHVRYFKLFSVLSFHRSIFQILKSERQNYKTHDLYILARVLTKVFGPLSLVAAKSCQEQSKKDAMTEASLENYVRPLAAFEHLRESSLCDGEMNYEILANETIQEIYNFVHVEGSVSVVLLEKCAKSIATVARQRTCTSNSMVSLFPSIISLALFVRLPNHQRESSYQISTRLAHLANALQSSGFLFHAMVVLALVIAQELSNSYSVDPVRWQEIEFLRFFAARGKGMFMPLSSNYQPTTLARSSLRRLISLMKTTILQDEQAHLDQTYNSQWDALLAGFGANISCSDLLATIQDHPSLAVLLPKVLEWVHPEDKDSPVPALRLFMILVDVLMELGASLQENPPGPITQWQLQDFKSILHHLETQIIPKLSSSTCNLYEMVQAVAATALTDTTSWEKAIIFNDSSSEQDQPDILKTSCEMAQDALSRLHSIELSDQNPSVCRQMVALAVHYFCWRTQRHEENEATTKLFQRCHDTVEAFRKSSSDANGEVTEFCRNSLLWTLSQLQNQFESMNDPTRTFVIMQWILELLNKDDINIQFWFRSVVISTILSSPYASINGEFDFKESLHALSSGSMEWFAQQECRLALLRARIAFGTDGDSSSLTESAHSIKEELQAIEEDDSKRNPIIFWLLSTLELTFAEMAASLGSFTDSLKHLQESSRFCMAVMSSSRGRKAPDGCVPLWENIATTTLLSRANRRYMEILVFRSKLYARIGDHRKAIAYVATLFDFFGLDLKPIQKDLGPDVMDMLSSELDVKAKHFRRINAKIQCSANPQELVLKGLSETGQRWLQSAWTESADVALQLQLFLDVVSVGDMLYGESIRSSFQRSFPHFYREAADWYQKIASSNFFETHKSLSTKLSTAISATLAVREIRCLLYLHSKLDTEVQSKVKDLCDMVKGNVAANASDKAWANFYEADIEITNLNRSGTLDRLWMQQGNQISEDDKHSLQRVRDLLSKAASIQAIGSDILSRLILRSLALVTGPENGCINNSMAGSLILMSIGQSYRQLIVRTLNDSRAGNSEHSNTLIELFSRTGVNGIKGEGSVHLLDSLAGVAPDNWKFVAAALCPSGDLLVTSIQKDPDLGEMSVTTSRVKPHQGESVYRDMLVPLDEIIRDSQNQLCGMDVDTVSELYSEEAAKRNWWDTRYKLDKKLQSLLGYVEDAYFPSLHLRTGSNDCIFNVDESTTLPVGNLASKFEAVAQGTPPNVEDSDQLRKLTIPMLKQRLRDEFGFAESKFRKMKKQDLIDLLLSERNAKEKTTREMGSDGCLFLILDENLQRFPFEGLSSLAGHSVCRVPSLEFIVSSLLENGLQHACQIPHVDPYRSSYVLDPESNLISTRKRLKPVLDSIASRQNWEWDSAVGEIPTNSFMENGLCRQHGLFMYFGHGGAQRCYSRKQVESLIKRNDQHNERACRATVILMGCSSGRLVSINRKDSRATEEMPLYYEPEGIALSYLCAGAPCVVGNLWDVTDGDIDRYSTTLLEQFLLSDSDRSLASCVATSRSACKLRFIVGCAPVCYGVPVYLMK